VKYVNQGGKSVKVNNQQARKAVKAGVTMLSKINPSRTKAKQVAG
jgi:hypothetical protein